MQHLKSPRLAEAARHTALDIYSDFHRHPEAPKWTAKFSQTYDMTEFDTATYDYPMQNRIMPHLFEVLARYNVPYKTIFVRLRWNYLSNTQVAVEFNVIVDR